MRKCPKCGRTWLTPKGTLAAAGFCLECLSELLPPSAPELVAPEPGTPEAVLWECQRLSSLVLLLPDAPAKLSERLESLWVEMSRLRRGDPPRWRPAPHDAPTALEMIREAERWCRSLDSPASSPDEEADRLMRDAIRQAKDGRKAKTDALILAAGVGRKRGLDALRRLQEAGEYQGHAKKKSARYGRRA
jgi:hypothetical protein